MAFLGSDNDRTLKLGIVNAVGYGATTIMPLWIDGLPSYLSAPSWIVGLAATCQLIACGLMNIATPWLFTQAPPLRLARVALFIAACAGVIQAIAPIGVFIAAALASGAALGIVLNSTNRIIAASLNAQKSYSVFQLVEVCFAATLFLGSATLMSHLGVHIIFLALTAACLLGLLSLHGLREEMPAPSHAQTDYAVGHSGLAFCTLLAMLLFFIGQSSVNSFLIPLGRISGLATDWVATTMAIAMLAAFGGALAARLIGDRFGMVAPVATAAAILAVVSLLLMHPLPSALFALCVVAISACTIFTMPYYFTFLARIDASGRAASIGPAFLLAGVAIGPSVAIGISQNFQIGWIGPTAAIGLLLASALFARTNQMFNGQSL